MSLIQRQDDHASESSADLSELRGADRILRSLEGATDKGSESRVSILGMGEDLSTATIAAGDSGYIKALIKRANEIQEESTAREDRDLQRIDENRIRDIRAALDHDPNSGLEDRVDLKALSEHCREIGISSTALVQAYYESTNNPTYEENLAKLALAAGLPTTATVEQINAERARQKQEDEISRWASWVKLEIPELVEKIRMNPLDYPNRAMRIKREYQDVAMSGTEAMSAFVKTLNPEFMKTAATYTVPLIGWLLFVVSATSDDMKLFPPLMIPNPSKPMYRCLKELQLEAQKYGAEIEFSLEKKERFSIRWYEPAINAVLKLKKPQ
jgi:hypothetical protein